MELRVELNLQIKRLATSKLHFQEGRPELSAVPAIARVVSAAGQWCCMMRCATKGPLSNRAIDRALAMLNTSRRVQPASWKACAWS